MKPEVTIYITNHNYSDYLSKAIDSCLNQTFKNIEIIIIDDGSTDGSQEIINTYASSHQNIIPIFKKNQGLIKACNTALSSARGQFIIRLDADDWFDKNAIKLMVYELNQDRKLQIIFPDYYEVNKDGDILRSIRRHNFEKVSLLDQPAHGACTMFRTKTLILDGGYDEFFNCQDGLDIWHRFIKKHKVRNLNIPLFYYRKHELSITRNTQNILINKNKILKKNNSSKDKKIVAILPIRGPKYDKFSRVFSVLGKKRLIDWTLEYLLKISPKIDIIVTSPDVKVLNFIKNKKKSRIIPIYRPPELASANILLSPSIIEAKKEYKKKKKIDPDFIVLVKLNSPFMNCNHIENAINTMNIFDLDMVLGVSTNDKMYFNHNGQTLVPLRTYDRDTLLNTDGAKVSIKIEGEEIYFNSGNFIVYNSKKIKDFDSFKNLTIGHEILDKLSAFELQGEFEFELAKKISKNLKKFTKI
jgi:glycosyltransferase involved in cell wall biosynthesis